MEMVLNEALNLDYSEGSGSLTVSWVNKNAIDQEVTFLFKDGRQLTLFSDGVFQVFDDEGQLIHQNDDIFSFLV